MNELRSAAGERALLQFSRDDGEVDDAGGVGDLAEQNLTDLLADLAHFCDRRGVSWRAVVARAEGHYREEVGGAVYHG